MDLKPDGVHFILCPKQNNKIEGVVLYRVRHGGHCGGDMVVRMRKVLAIPWSHVCFSAEIGIVYAF